MLAGGRAGVHRDEADGASPIMLEVQSEWLAVLAHERGRVRREAVRVLFKPLGHARVRAVPSDAHVRDELAGRNHRDKVRIDRDRLPVDRLDTVP